MGVSENGGFSPQIIQFNRDFHYKSSILGYPYFWKHPYNHPIGKDYKWYISGIYFQLGDSRYIVIFTYIIMTYHLLREPETAIELRLVVYPVIYRDFYMQTVVGKGICSINSMLGIFGVGWSLWHGVSITKPVSVIRPTKSIWQNACEKKKQTKTH